MGNRLGWTDLPKTAAAVTAAAERAEEAAETIARKTTSSGLLICLTAIVILFLTWAYAYWQSLELRQEQDRIKTEISQLQNAAGLLKGITGGGAKLEKMDNGDYVFTLPPGLVFRNTVAGANSVSYTSKKE